MLANVCVNNGDVFSSTSRFELCVCLKSTHIYYTLALSAPAVVLYFFIKRCLLLCIFLVEWRWVSS